MLKAPTGDGQGDVRMGGLTEGATDTKAGGASPMVGFLLSDFNGCDFINTGNVDKGNYKGLQ